MRIKKLNESINNAKIIEGIFNIGAAKKLNTILSINNFCSYAKDFIHI